MVGGRNVNQRARFILVGPDADGVERRDDAGMDLTRTFGVSHGTCMLSKVVGHLYGVAKKANPILVRVPRGDVLNGWLLPGGQKPTDYLKGVLMVLDDVQPGQPGAGIPAVLSMSFGIPRVSNGKWTLPDFMDPTKDDSTKFEEEFRDALKAVVNIGVHIVTTSGNDGKVSRHVLKSSSYGLFRQVNNRRMACQLRKDQWWTKLHSRVIGLWFCRRHRTAFLFREFGSCGPP